MRPSDPSAGARFSARSDPSRAPVLVCFSHLRWDFVFQRPQHLLTRAARQFRVYFVEEPIYRDVDAPSLDCTLAEAGVTVVIPVLREGTKRRKRQLTCERSAGERIHR